MALPYNAAMNSQDSLESRVFEYGCIPVSVKSRKVQDSYGYRSVLCKVQGQEDDARSRRGYDEERQAYHKGQVPRLWHHYLPYRRCKKVTSALCPLFCGKSTFELKFEGAFWLLALTLTGSAQFL